MHIRKIDVAGKEMYFRNNSTGNPTLIHFAKEDGKTFCGFHSWAAQCTIGDETEYVLETVCCKKCLSSIAKMQYKSATQRS